MENYRVTLTLEEAAAEIQRSSFALVRVPSRTAHSMQEAWREAALLLNHPPSAESDSANDWNRWTRIMGGHLHGYHEPSRAKRLFRAFVSSPHQPWPNERFRRASQTVAEQLHSILWACHAHLGGCKADDGLRLPHDQQPCREEQLLEGTLGREEDFLPETATTSAGSRKRRRLDEPCTRLPVPVPLPLPVQCPLDYFLYHNNDPTATNCSEHVDRGLLIAVCLTDVPGLEIRVPNNNNNDDDKEHHRDANWFCPEAAVHNSKLYSEISDSSVSDLICIMAGGDLSRTLEVDVPPCVHRVRNRLKRSRLSISYELRL